MRVIQTAEQVVAIWFIDEEAPPDRKTAALVRGALSRRGYTPWRHIEADRFAADNETLIIARKGS